MPFSDSIDKIVSVYFASITEDKFVYKGVPYSPRKLLVSSNLFRGYTCPPICGGCCRNFTLDYLPTEPIVAKNSLLKRSVVLDGKVFPIFSDVQKGNRSVLCKNLSLTDGRCLIYEERPFSCDFELIRFVQRDSATVLTQKLYARGWNMNRVDGGKGALCEMTSPDSVTTAEVVRKLKRLEIWSDYFGLKTKLPLIFDWIANGDIDQDLLLH